MKLPNRKQIMSNLYEHYEEAEPKDKLQWMKLFLVVSGYMKPVDSEGSKSENEMIEDNARNKISDAV
jgi:hypothetical protein